MNKNAFINVRVTPEEKQRLKREAQKQQIRPSEYARRLLQAAISTPTQPAQPTK